MIVCICHSLIPPTPTHLHRLSPSKFSDLILYIADIADSLCAFVDVFPPSCHELLTTGFAERLVTFYEAVVPELQSQWHLLKKKVDK